MGSERGREAGSRAGARRDAVSARAGACARPVCADPRRARGLSAAAGLLHPGPATGPAVDLPRRHPHPRRADPHHRPATGRTTRARPGAAPRPASGSQRRRSTPPGSHRDDRPPRPNLEGPSGAPRARGRRLAAGGNRPSLAQRPVVRNVGRRVVEPRGEVGAAEDLDRHEPLLLGALAHVVTTPGLA